MTLNVTPSMRLVKSGCPDRIFNIQKVIQRELAVTAGRLKHLLTIQQPETARDSMGGTTITWCSKRQVWAEITPVSARELVSGDQLTQDLTHIIRFRCLDGSRNTLTEVTAIEDLNQGG